MDIGNLPEEYPDVYEMFMNAYGQHVMRRVERLWAGLSSNDVIEVLMRSIKSCGGLTRGREMSETQRMQWVLSMPACAGVSNAMNEVIGSHFVTN